jgi:hypothetical protein
MTATHVHLMINHLPLFGTLLAALLLAYSLLAGKDQVRRASLGILVLLALASPVAYFSGEGAEDWAEDAGLSEDRIEAHEEAGKVAFALLLANGVVAAGVLVIGLLPSSARLAGRASWVVLVFALGVFLWMAWTARTGGLIRHEEEMSSVIPCQNDTMYDKKA